MRAMLREHCYAATFERVGKGRKHEKLAKFKEEREREARNAEDAEANAAERGQLDQRSEVQQRNNEVFKRWKADLAEREESILQAQLDNAGKARRLAQIEVELHERDRADGYLAGLAEHKELEQQRARIDDHLEGLREIKKWLDTPRRSKDGCALPPMRERFEREVRSSAANRLIEAAPDAPSAAAKKSAAPEIVSRKYRLFDPDPENTPEGWPRPGPLNGWRGSELQLADHHQVRPLERVRGIPGDRAEVLLKLALGPDGPAQLVEVVVEPVWTPPGQLLLVLLDEVCLSLPQEEFPGLGQVARGRC